ncbi:MAG: hypothetical protein WC319_03800 [Candidatus Paceibacterota bacterium]|jgi:hypothetical protein
MKNFKLLTKTAIVGYILLANVTVFGQDKQLYVEIKDTIETAYHTYFSGWEQRGFNYSQKTISDSIGIDSVIIKKLYYVEKYDPYIDIRAKSDTILPYAYRKVYLGYEERKYPKGNKSKDTRFSGF